MSMRVATATVPGLLSITEGPIPQLRRSEHKTKKTVAVALLAAAALAATIADAAASNHHRYSGAALARSSWVGHYSPSGYGRYDHGASERSPVEPFAGHGIFEEHLSAP
jgi:hypothetical protein